MTANKVWALAGSAAVAAAVIAGLYVIGAPSEERALRLDERRLTDLMRLTAAVDAYWSMHDELPRNLDELMAAQRLRDVPTDPISGHPYTYETIDRDSYRLCTTFDRPSRASEPSNFWQHDAGAQCFDMNVVD